MSKIMANMSTVILPIFFIWLCSRLVLVIINLALIRLKAKSWGKIICTLPNLMETTSQRKLFYLMLFPCVIDILLCLSLMFLTKELLLYMAGVVLLLTVILRAVLVRKVSARNGFYENGFVVGMFSRYDKIHSYKMLDTGEVELLMKNGCTLNLMLPENVDKVVIDRLLALYACPANLSALGSS